MNSYCRELLSPKTGIAALTLTVMKGFEAKKRMIPVHSAYIPLYCVGYSSTLCNFTSGRSRTRVRWLEDRRSNYCTT